MIEVNGVHHYPRNSENCLGRDVIKKRILENEGYIVISIPYYHWYILEDKLKPKYLLDVIENSLI